MAIMVSDNSKAFAPAPEGIHQAVCCDVIDHGICETKFGTKPRVELRWVINETNDDGRLFMVTKRYTASLNEKATLRQDIETWRGKKFAKSDLKNFDLEQLIGDNCQVQIVHSTSDDGRTWANVKAIVPLSKGMSRLEIPADFTRKTDRMDVDLPPEHAPF